MATKSGNTKFIIIAIIIAAIAGFVYVEQNKKPKTVGERIDNAAEKISDGVTDAGRELDPDRTVGEKIGDAIEDAGKKIEGAGENIQDKSDK